MPIKAANRLLYPGNWKEVRACILKRATNCCEFCGLKNRAYGFRNRAGEFIEIEPHPFIKTFQIVLTIAHLDHNPTNNAPDNLRALCQKCHLAYDAEHHAKNRRATQEAKVQTRATEREQDAWTDGLFSNPATR